jgi:hypothetical protein
MAKDNYETKIFVDPNYRNCDDEFNQWLTETKNNPGLDIEIISSNMFCVQDPNYDTSTFYIYVLYKETRKIDFKSY